MKLLHLLFKSIIIGILYMIKTFQDRKNPNKKFYHVNLFGLKFRVETYPRQSRIGTKNFYSLSNGYVFNAYPKRYFRFIK